MTKLILSMVATVLTITVGMSGRAIAGDRSPPLHLFILSGQSNMVLLNPSLTLKPALSKVFGAEHVLVVKNAIGGQPIRRWYKGWNIEGDDLNGSNNDLHYMWENYTELDKRFAAKAIELLGKVEGQPLLLVRVRLRVEWALLNCQHGMISWRKLHKRSTAAYGKIYCIKVEKDGLN